jgi:hypothetical protein
MCKFFELGQLLFLLSDSPLVLGTIGDCSIVHRMDDFFRRLQNKQIISESWKGRHLALLIQRLSQAVQQSDADKLN